jgi:hypothetical protein
VSSVGHGMFNVLVVQARPGSSGISHLQLLDVSWKERMRI